MNGIIVKVLKGLPMGTFVYIGAILAYGIPFVWWLFLIILGLDIIDDLINL